jgi:GNAT superfamily N-acetyltransferase
VETARLATASDIDALAALWELSVAELDGQRGGALLAGSLDRKDLRGFLAGALNDPDRAMALGLIDDVAVGLASVVADRTQPEPVGVLEVIYVEPTARQVGVAEAMLETVLGWCRGVGLVGVDAPALPGNRAAKAFFEGQGFLARLLIMHRAVGAPVEDDDGSDPA